MSGAHADREIIAKANELYWGSDLSVNHIADELDLSKGALYGMILPEKTGTWCPDCGSSTGFENRTAKDRGVVSCAECGWEGERDDAEDYAGAGSVTLPDIAEEEDDEVMLETPPDLGRSRVAWGGALLGAAAGLALVFWARRR